MRVHTPLACALSAFVAVAAQEPVTASSGSEGLSINGWYPCGFSNRTPFRLDESSSLDIDEKLPFECAEVRVPLCYEGICDSDSEIDVFVKRMMAMEDVGVGTSVWMLQGGPGASSAGMEYPMMDVYSRLNGTVSVYTMDHRGTGRSALLKCEAAEGYSAGSPGGVAIDFSEVANCVKDVLYQIEGQTAAFSVTSAAKDVELLTRELNEEDDVFVYGASYGTYLAERVMHLAPANVKGYIVDGVVSEALASFAHFGSNREEPGEHFGQLCDNDTVCRTKYGSDVPGDQKMYDAWLATYQKLDEAKVGENACADMLRGIDEDVTSSDLLRIMFASDVSVSNPWSRDTIPAVFQMLRRCNETDVSIFRSILDLPQGSSYNDKLNHMDETIQSFDAVNSNSDLLMFLIKSSELWTYPSPTWEGEKELDDKGVFTLSMEEDYSWHCVLSGNWSDPTCPALSYYGQQQLPPVDYSSIELASFTYKPDQYYRKHAKIPDGASVMVMNGKLDFQTIHEWAVDQYENMEGDNKMLVEFENGPHCPGYAPTTAEDETSCGARIIVSYITVGGDVVKTDTSCMAELPAINFESDDRLNYFAETTGGSMEDASQVGVEVGDESNEGDVESGSNGVEATHKHKHKHMKRTTKHPRRRVV